MTLALKGVELAISKRNTLGVLIMNCSLPCGCGECDNQWIKLVNKPKAKIVDVLYFDGKVFYNKPIENCYFGPDTLITHYKVVK